MIRRSRARRLGAGLSIMVTLAVGCGPRIEPIVVDGARLVITNTSDKPWKNVEVWANTFYRARVDELLPGGRLDAPLRRFAGPYGRSFDPTREALRGVEVTALTPDGERITLVWGEGRTWRGTFD